MIGLGAAPADGRSATRAQDTPRLLLGATFNPERLGAPTAIGFWMRVDARTGEDPPPVTAVNVSYPSNLGIAISGLGLETCQPATLEQRGARSCPPDALMGHGSAVVQVNFGPEIVTETVSLSIYAAPSNDGYIHLAILADGKEPVLASIVLPGVLYPGQLQITVPPIESVPGAPNAALVSMHATLGGHLTYYENSHGHTLAYHPRGIELPDSCPRDGFRFSVHVSFADAPSSTARAQVPCPRTHSGGIRRGGGG